MAQLLVSPLICPVARFSAGGPRVCVRVVVGPTGHCPCGILLAGVHLETVLTFLACHGPERVFISSIGSGLAVRNKANPDRYWRNRYALCFNIWNQAHQSETIPHSPCQLLRWWLCSRKKRNCFSLTVMSAHHLETPPHLPFHAGGGALISVTCKHLLPWFSASLHLCLDTAMPCPTY